MKNHLWGSSSKIHPKNNQGPVSISAHIMSQTEMYTTQSIEKTMKKCTSNKKSQ